MIGRASKLGKDGKTWWRQDVSSPQHHLKNWKMMLWVLASLLTLVEDVFSEEDNKESDLQHVLRLPSVSPAKDLDRGSRGHISWPGALGKYFNDFYH
ncbi:hypothetical protein OYC64_021219 [Pagothenia borchgrevinki]|uniref:Uncharacterized protein n=1 Tax=Pagothenia borchgrevinki TaxID=8213 RepID=A0ABD2FZ96_PAGBO